MVDTISGLFSKMGDIANGIFGNVNQSKYGTDSYNQRLAAEANAAAANAKQKNTGLCIAIVVVALLMVVGFALVITKKRK